MICVFDLDNTLIYTIENAPKDDYNWECDVVRCKTIIRPGAKELIKSMQNIFKYVGVWSAGDKEYVEGIVDNFFSDVAFDFIWNDSDCEHTFEGGDGYCPHKPLYKLWKYLGEGDKTDTIIIDDRSTIARRNPSNLILVPSFEGKSSDDKLKILKIFVERYFPRAYDIRQICKTWNARDELL